MWSRRTERRLFLPHAEVRMERVAWWRWIRELFASRRAAGGVTSVVFWRFVPELPPLLVCQLL